MGGVCSFCQSGNEEPKYSDVRKPLAVDQSRTVGGSKVLVMRQSYSGEVNRRPHNAQAHTVSRNSHPASVNGSGSSYTGSPAYRGSVPKTPEYLRQTEVLSPSHRVKTVEKQYSDEDQQIAADSTYPATVSVTVPPGPLGLLLDAEFDDMAVVDGFTNLPDNTIGALEGSGLVHPGYVLVAINGMSVSGLPLDKIIILLQQTSRIQRVLTFSAAQQE